MGKTAKGAVWLDPNKTSPFEFFQYWRNIDDADVLKCIRMLTFLPLEEIDKMDKWQGNQLNEAKELLAFELTKMVHGEDEAQKAKETSHALFGFGTDDTNMPMTEITEEQLIDGAIDIVNLMVICGLTASRNESRRLIQQGGIFINDAKIVSINFNITLDQLKNGVKIRRGKKTFHKALMN